MIQEQVDHIGLNVKNIEQSLAFYQEMFGFELIVQWDSPKQAFIRLGKIVLGLMEKSDYDYNHYTMAHIAFSCQQDDFAAIVGKVNQLQLAIVSGPKPQRGGETILFRDISGNILEICYPSIQEWQTTIKNNLMNNTI